MSPTGKLHKVNSAGGHVAFIRQNPDIFGKTDEENDDYDLAFKKDWIRIINSYERLIFEFPSKNDKYLQRVQKKLNELPEKRIVSFVFDGIHEIDVPYSVFANAWDFRDIERSRNAVIKGAAEKDPEFMTHLDPEKKYVSEPEGFMRDVETGEREPAYLDESICEDCGETMPLDVHKSAAGWYIGRFCKNCGPHSRESGYFKNEKEARDALDEYKMSQEGPEEFEQIDVSKMASISKRAKDPLSKYKKKREFNETPEPEGKAEKGKNQYRFVIQRHKAKKAGEHFDLRLENDKGAMSSWAIPKHKLPTGSEKLLAMKTEDHPISYNKFKGEIPEGEYGAGTVEIYDSGKYEEIEHSTNKIVFKLKGKKEKGTYNLFKTDGKKWMIMVYNKKKESNSRQISKRAADRPRPIPAIMEDLEYTTKTLQMMKGLKTYDTIEELINAPLEKGETAIGSGVLEGLEETLKELQEELEEAKKQPASLQEYKEWNDFVKKRNEKYAAIKERISKEFVVLVEEEYGYKYWFWFPGISPKELEFWWKSNEHLPNIRKLGNCIEDEYWDLFVDLRRTGQYYTAHWHEEEDSWLARPDGTYIKHRGQDKAVLEQDISRLLTNIKDKTKSTEEFAREAYEEYKKTDDSKKDLFIEVLESKPGMYMSSLGKDKNTRLVEINDEDILAFHELVE